MTSNASEESACGCFSFLKNIFHRQPKPQKEPENPFGIPIDSKVVEWKQILLEDEIFEDQMKKTQEELLKQTPTFHKSGQEKSDDSSPTPVVLDSPKRVITWEEIEQSFPQTTSKKSKKKIKHPFRSLSSKKEANKQTVTLPEKKEEKEPKKQSKFSSPSSKPNVQKDHQKKEEKGKLQLLIFEREKLKNFALRDSPSKKSKPSKQVRFSPEIGDRGLFQESHKHKKVPRLPHSLRDKSLFWQKHEITGIFFRESVITGEEIEIQIIEGDDESIFEEIVETQAKTTQKVRTSIN